MYDVYQKLEKQNIELEYHTIYDMKSIKDVEKDIRIYNIQTHFSNPHLIFIGSSQGILFQKLVSLNLKLGLYILNIIKYHHLNILFHPTFSINANISQVIP